LFPYNKPKTKQYTGLKHSDNCNVNQKEPKQTHFCITDSNSKDQLSNISIYHNVSSAGLNIVPFVPWEKGGARERGNQMPIFTTLFWCLNVEKTFTNHKFRIGLHVTIGLNDRRIPIQYPSSSARGFGEATELLIARWVKLLDTGMWLFCFDTLW